MWRPDFPAPDFGVVLEAIKSPPGKIISAAILGAIGAAAMESNILLGGGLGLLAGMFVVIVKA